MFKKKGFTPTPIAYLTCPLLQLVWGFTLIELMVVIAIIAALTAVVAPYLTERYA